MNLIAKKRWEVDIDKYDLPHLRIRQIAELVRQISPATYVDLGCAKGTLGQLTPGINYIGCDFAVTENKGQFEFYNCDFNNENLPNKIKGYSLFTCSGLLEYIENVDSFLLQINGAISNDGTLIVSYFNMNHFSRIVKLISGKSFPVHPDWRGFFSPHDFTKKLENAGFAVQKIIPVSHGFGNSPAVSETIDEKTVLPTHRFYSNLFAHQLIYICLKRDAL